MRRISQRETASQQVSGPVGPDERSEARNLLLNHTFARWDMSSKFLEEGMHPFLPIKQNESPVAFPNREKGRLGCLRNSGIEVSVPNPAIATARALQTDIVGRLAKFFPEATPVRIPIRLSRANGQETSFFQDTVIEFGTPQEVLFALDRPLEFADRVLVENRDG